jgi:hypothetical protein
MNANKDECRTFGTARMENNGFSFVSFVIIRAIRCFFSLLLIFFPAFLSAQEFNSVPLGHPAYDIIETGAMYGACSLPPSAKPWSERMVKELLWEILNDPSQRLTSGEIETAGEFLESFNRKTGFDSYAGRYSTEGDNSFEAGFGWGSDFSVEAPGGAISTVNFAKIYSGGDWGDSFSWNVTAFGGFLYIGRTEYSVPPAFPYSLSRQWDGGVVSLKNPGDYSAWPDDFSMAGGFQAEVNGVFWEDRIKLRAGRIRRDWGRQTASLFLNARPFAALEGTVSPLPWLDIFFLGGALERYSEDGPGPDGPFSNILSLARVELNPGRYFSFGAGGAVVALGHVDAVFFTDIELRLPGLFTLWGGLFVDQLDLTMDSPFSRNGNSYAFQAGLKTLVRWLPLATFTMHYTKVEPYCYGAYVSGGESLGYYLPPNSDELFLGLETRLSPGLKVFIRFQMIRHGADYGYGAVDGSSLQDELADPYSAKFFLMDGVYQRDNVIKAGGEITVRSWAIPCSFFIETGWVSTRFSRNGNAGKGNEADYEIFEDEVYKPGGRFIFSAGFRLFF